MKDGLKIYVLGDMDYPGRMDDASKKIKKLFKECSDVSVVLCPNMRVNNPAENILTAFTYIEEADIIVCVMDNNGGFNWAILTIIQYAKKMKKRILYFTPAWELAELIYDGMPGIYVDADISEPESANADYIMQRFMNNVNINCTHFKPDFTELIDQCCCNHRMEPYEGK